MPPATFHAKRLSTYLNDHLAVATAGVELAKRSLGSNEGTPYEPVLRRICDDMSQDRRLLNEFMRCLEVDPSTLKNSLAWLGEKIGRLKLNDSLVGYSPLSRVVELEGLTAILTLLRGAWASLGELFGGDDHVPDVAGARERAEFNLAALEALRPRAMREALTVEARVAAAR